MLSFDQDVNSIEDFLSDEDLIDLTDPKWNFKYHVRESMKKGLTRSEAEQSVEETIRTKFTNKRCKCGEVAQVFDPEDKPQIYCGRCWYAKTGRYNNG